LCSRSSGEKKYQTIFRSLFFGSMIRLEKANNSGLSLRGSKIP
jgi:hypothetical protein